MLEPCPEVLVAVLWANFGEIWAEIHCGKLVLQLLLQRCATRFHMKGCNSIVVWNKCSVCVCVSASFSLCLSPSVSLLLVVLLVGR